MNMETLSRFYAEAKIVLPLCLFAVIILVVPYMLRDDSLMLGGREPYQILRAAENPFDNYDELSYGGRFRIFNAYPLVLSIASSLLGISLVGASKTVPLVFGMASIILFYFILKKIGIDLFGRVISFILTAISPPFIYMSTVSNVYVIPVMLLLLSFLLLLHERKIIAYITFSSILFFGMGPFLISLGLLVIYLLKSKDYKGLYLALLLLIFIIPLVKLGMPEFLGFAKMPEGIKFRVQVFIAEFGGETGLSIFAVLLSLFGLKDLWQKKYEHIMVYAIIIMIVASSFFEAKYLIYLNFVVAVIAAIGISRLIYSKWDSVLINVIIGMLLIAGLVYSTVTYVTFLSDSLPNKEIIESLEFLRQESRENEVVFSYYTKGYWINYFAERKNVMDEGFFYAHDVNIRHNDSTTLFYTRNIEEAKGIIEKYDIDYIWIDAAMKTNQVWSERDEGLLFLLSASRMFKKEYDNGYVEIWKVVS